MFIDRADETRLRQGDILSGIPCPLIKIAGLPFSGFLRDSSSNPPMLAAATHTHNDDPRWLTAQIPIYLSYCVVTAQCCDLELRNGKFQLNAFSLARLRPVPSRIRSDAQRYASLIANKDPRSKTDPGFLNMFHIPSHPALENTDWIVDLNQIFFLPKSEFEEALKRKILQMDDVSRVKFKIKLAASLTRMTDEEHAAGIVDPWKAEATNK